MLEFNPANALDILESILLKDVPLSESSGRGKEVVRLLHMLALHS